MDTANKINIDQLREVPETLLIPLWARAQDAGRAEPILGDTKAVEIIDSLDYDFSGYARRGVDVSGFCSRAHVFDLVLRDFLTTHPDGTVVEFGPGLDTRFDRLDNGTVRWFEIDLPVSMSVRQKFFQPAPRRSMIAASALEPDWIESLRDVGDPQQIMFVAEGVVHYFTKQQLKNLLVMLVDNFPGSQILFDCQSWLYGWYAKLRHPVRRSPFLLAMKDIREVERWDDRISVKKCIGFGDPPYYDQHFSKLPWLHRTARHLLPPVRNMFIINLLQLGQPQTGS